MTFPRVPFENGTSVIVRRKKKLKKKKRCGGCSFTFGCHVLPVVRAPLSVGVWLGVWVCEFVGVYQMFSSSSTHLSVWTRSNRRERESQQTRLATAKKKRRSIFYFYFEKNTFPTRTKKNDRNGRPWRRSRGSYREWKKTKKTNETRCFFSLSLSLSLSKETHSTRAVEAYGRTHRKKKGEKSVNSTSFSSTICGTRLKKKAPRTEMGKKNKSKRKSRYTETIFRCPVTRPHSGTNQREATKKWQTKKKTLKKTTPNPTRVQYPAVMKRDNRPNKPWTDRVN